MEVNPNKTYTTKEASRPPKDTVRKASTKTSLENVLKGHKDALLFVAEDSASISEKLYPQGKKKENEFGGDIKPTSLLDKISDRNDVDVYVSEIHDNGTQTVYVRYGNLKASVYRYELAVDARKVAWEV